MKFFLTNWLLATALSISFTAADNNVQALRGTGGQKLQSIHHRILEEDETGTFLVAEIEYPDESQASRRPEQTFNIELGNGHIYTLTNVNPSWENGNRQSLQSGLSKIKIGKGATIAGDKLDLHGGAPEEVRGLFDRQLAEDSSHRKLAVTGTRTVLAVKVIAPDGEYSFTDKAGLSDDVFGTSGDLVNLASQYSACSFNQLNFVPAEHSQVENGVVEITVTTNTTEGDGVMRNAITAAINAQFGVSSPSQLAQHVMYCLPSGTMGGIAYAYINSWNSVYSNQWCNYVSGQMHEIGHNLGFAHSNEGGNSYQDQSGMMGFSYGQDDGPRMCFNSAKSYQTGWYPTKVVEPTDANCAGFDGKLYGLSDYNNDSTHTTVVKINTSGATDYYVNYNRKTGVNSGTVEGGNQVMITQAGGEGSSYAESSLLSKLNPGDSSTIANFENSGKDVTIVFEANEVDGAGTQYARVVISYDGMVCGSSTLSPVTPSPTKAPVTAPPSTSPTPSPTKAPVTPSPSLSPTTNAPVTSPPTAVPTTATPTNKPTLFPTKAPVTSSPTPEPCWESGTACDANGAHNCCKGCQANGRWANTCK